MKLRICLLSLVAAATALSSGTSQMENSPAAAAAPVARRAPAGFALAPRKLTSSARSRISELVERAEELGRDNDKNDYHARNAMAVDGKMKRLAKELSESGDLGPNWEPNAIQGTVSRNWYQPWEAKRILEEAAKEAE